jgi:hypothetical protein
MFFENGALQRTVARGGGKEASRPLAVSKAFRLVADSLDALMPAQQLQKVIAIGDARGESIDTTRARVARPDSTGAAASAVDSAAARVAARAPTPAAAPARADSAARRDTTATAARPSAGSLALTDSDWIVGDTITGFFATVPDTAKAKEAAGTPAPAKPAGAKPDSTVELQRIVARGNALSLYRIQQKQSGTATPPDSTQARPGINFLSGSEIELTFKAGELEVADVKGLEKGLYLDPARPARPAPAEEGSTEPAKPSAPPQGNP